MDINLILGIIGVIATLFLGVAGIWYTLKYRKKVKLTFIQQECFSLFNTIVKNLDEVEIKFKGNQVNENLLFLKGVFLNSGNSDLDKNNVHSPLRIILPDNFEWRMTNINNNSEGMQISQAIENNKLTFDWDLMKKNEFVSFDSLIEYTGTSEDLDEKELQKKLKKELQFEHRITNLDKISTDEIAFSSKSKKDKRFNKIMYSYLVLMLIMCISLPFSRWFFPQYELSFSLQDKEDIKRVEISPQRDKSVELRDYETDELLSKGDVDSIFSKNFLIPTIEERNDKELFLINILVGIMAVLIIVALILFAYTHRKEKKLLKQIELKTG